MHRKDITLKLLKKLYLEKLLSQREITLLLQCNITTIHKKMGKFNIPTRTHVRAGEIAMKKRIIKIPRYKLENLYLKGGFSIPQIAKTLNCDRSIIVRELKRNSVSRRSHGEAISLGWKKKRVKKSTIKKLYYKDRLTQKEIARKLNKSTAYICKLMRVYNLKTRTADKYHTRYQKYNFSKNSQEKAYLIGFRLGDLAVNLSPSKNLVIVSTTSTKNEQLTLFKNLFKQYGYIWISKKREDGNRVCLTRLNRSFDFMLPKKDNIPKWIQGNKNLFLSFFAGYTDAEGCISIGGNNVALFKLSSYDKNILKQIYKQLLKIGIECNQPRIHVKKGYRKSDGSKYRNDEWSFVVAKKSSLLRLLQCLEPKIRHSKRLTDLKKAMLNINKRNQKTLPERASLKYLPV